RPTRVSAPWARSRRSRSLLPRSRARGAGPSVLASLLSGSAVSGWQDRQQRLPGRRRRRWRRAAREAVLPWAGRLRLLGDLHAARGRRIDLQRVAAPRGGVAGAEVEQLARRSEAVDHLLRRDRERTHLGEARGACPDVADRLLMEVAHRPPPLHARVDVAVRVDGDARGAGAAVLLGR